MNSAKIIKSDNTAYRRHIFPPLRVVGAATLSDTDNESAPNFEQGFQQGLEEGHKEGIEQGLQQGLATGHQEGHNAGFQQGAVEGQVQGAQLFKDAVADLAAVQQKVDQLAKHKLVAQQELIADLVGQVSRQVIRAELTLNPKQVLNLVEEAMQAFAGDMKKYEFSSMLTIKNASQISVFSELNDWVLEADEKLAVGDSYIHSSDKEIAVDTEERFQQCMESVNQSITETS